MLRFDLAGAGCGRAASTGWGLPFSGSRGFYPLQGPWGMCALVHIPAMFFKGSSSSEGVWPQAEAEPLS